MKIEVLREFVALAHYGSFHATAESLFISQPSLSNHIKTLELEIGFELFDRSHGNELTAAGSIFFDTAQSALTLIDTTLEACRHCAGIEQNQAKG
ncbi:MAG: LysR family transcriptional regulator [Raoultibacter sp.]